MGLSDEAREAITRASLRVVDRERNPLLRSLPEWVQGYRPHQVEAIERVNDAFTRVPLVVVSAPTGSGKTLIGETVGRMQQTKRLYMCSSKPLQDQFLHDYPYAKVLKGRANYPTARYAEEWPELTCDDCEWSISQKCRWCGFKGACPYENAKQAALHADLAVLNTSYFLAEANNIGRFSQQPFVIADEADELESSLMGYVSINITEGRLKRWGWDPPEKVTVKESWVEWLEAKIKWLQTRGARIPADSQDVKVQRERRFIYDLMEKMRLVLNGMDTNAWVYTGRGKKDEKRAGVSFKPSRVDFLGKKMLWDHGEKWLLMSATVISPAHLLSSLGYEGAYEAIDVANTFPVENRRVVVRSVANMGQKNAQESWPKIAAACISIAEAEPDNRILIHSVSYKLTEFIANSLVVTERPIYTYSKAGERDAALQSFRATDSSILVAPSFSRGIDLAGDDCRVQVLVKVPYGNLGDRQVAARLFGSRDGRTWYTVNAIRDIVQSCGRAVRSKDDWARTYILDAQFADRLWNEGRNLFPRWFVDALVWERRAR